MKDSFWFQHDSNAQHDERVLELRAEYGWEGYGLFWGLVEKMRDSPDYRLSMATVGGLSAGMGVLKPLLLGLIDLACTYGLLATEEDGAYFYSPSLRRRMGQWDSKKASLSEAGRVGAERKKALKEAATLAETEATLKPPLSHPSTTLPVLQAHKITEQKREQPMSDSATPSPDGAGFDSFWDAYGRKEGSKGKMARQWNTLKLATRLTILNGLAAYKQAKTVNGPQFLPMPQTFLNGKLWEAETYGTAPAIGQYQPAAMLDPETDRLRAFTQEQAALPAPVMVYRSAPNRPAQLQPSGLTALPRA